MAVVDSLENGQFDVQAAYQTLTQTEDLGPPTAETLVFKDECLYCFNTPLNTGGLYVCLKHYVGLCSNHVSNYVQANSDSEVFLRIQQFKIEKIETDEPKDKMQRLCIAAENLDSEEKFSIVVSPHFTVDIPINEPNLPLSLQEIVQKTIQHHSATLQQRLNSGASEWDGESRKIAENCEDLLQLNVDKPIPYSGWKCEEPDCGLEENLWLNLSDGVIKCGRSQYLADGKMTKGLGNYHAKKHAEESGFPLAVKLGTVQNGDADVYSYIEKESVKDPYLRQHLAHFGLDLDKLEKTEKSTLEMELDLNQKWEWSRCLEDGVTLENAFGPGFTGLINIGSSCYINSVIQCLCEDSLFIQAFTNLYRTDLKAQELIQKHNDFAFQLARLLNALKSGEYSRENSTHNGIKPAQFRKIAGQGHPEFSTAKQQDAEEYIRHLFNKFEENALIQPNPVEDFRFRVVKRFEDVASHKVRYQDTDEYILSLPIPKDKLREVPLPQDLVNIPEILPELPENQSRKCIDLSQLIENFSASQFIDGFVSPITNEAKGALQQYRIASFPEMLVLQINRFEHDENYQPKKINVEVNVPDTLDITAYRFEGQQAGEELLNDSIEVPVIDVTSQPVNFNVNDNYVNEVMNLGFSRNAAERAVYSTGNSGPDVAAEWLFGHMEDTDINEPHPDLVKSRLRAPNSRKNAEDGKVQELSSLLGISAWHAKYSLNQTNQDLNAAAEWYFQNTTDIPEEPAPQPAPQTSEQPSDSTSPSKPAQRPVKDGSGRYQLVAFITHMGRSPQSGHYVCHIQRNGVWYLFNDEKVAVSHNPPKTMGYLYFYKRN